MAYYALFIASVLVPGVAHASHVGNGLFGLLLEISDLLQSVVVIIFGLALLFFFWGLARFVLSGGNEEQRNKGKAIIVWGLIGLFVMFSIWGIIEALQLTFFEYGTDNVLRLDSLR